MLHCPMRQDQLVRQLSSGHVARAILAKRWCFTVHLTGLAISATGHVLHVLLLWRRPSGFWLADTMANIPHAHLPVIWVCRHLHACILSLHCTPPPPLGLGRKSCVCWAQLIKWGANRTRGFDAFYLNSIQKWRLWG